MSKTLGALLFVVAFVNGIPTHAEVPQKSKNDISNDTADELAKVQGKWVRTMKTDSGTFKVIKEHQGNTTILTFFDSMGNVVAGKKSEFRLEKTGKVRIFTFFNNVVTAGPQKGQTDKEPQSYIFRVTEDSFFEIRGLLIGDDVEPVAITWKRFNE